VAPEEGQNVRAQLRALLALAVAFDPLLVEHLTFDFRGEVQLRDRGVGGRVGPILAGVTAALARGRPALTFYPAAALRRLFAGYGWTFERERTLLDPVPWTESHLDAHAGAARAATTGVTGPVAESLESLIDRVEERVDPASVGEMYSVAM